MDSDIENQLSKQSIKRLFYNAETETDQVFQFALNAPIQERKEVNEEPEPINPYEAIDKKNEEYEKLLYDLAFKSDENQTLIRDPSKPADKKAAVTLDELPAIVRQAAEAALLKKLRAHKSTTKS